MTVTPDPVGPGQESVWAFPRPSIARPSARHLRIDHRGQVVAETRRAVRTIETSHPPTWYFPPGDVHAVVTRSPRAGSFCEWKGSAVYFDVTVAGVTLHEVAWSYPRPTAPFAAIAGYLAFYAAPFDGCFVDGERIRPQPGGFYGGWITRDLAGPFKGVPGSQFWWERVRAGRSSSNGAHDGEGVAAGREARHVRRRQGQRGAKAMKVAIIGATGLLGVALVPEAAARGHAVTALCRHPEQVPARDGVTAVACDLFDTATLTGILAGHDAVIFSYSPRRDHDSDRTGPHLAATRATIAATRAAGVKRLLAVGGAGTLLLPDGSQVMDSPMFPPEYMESAISTGAVKTVLAAEADDLDWTFLSPALFFDERGRSGVFRLGLDDALFDADGKSGISVEDYAIAMIDEFDSPRHTKRRFTVGY